MRWILIFWTAANGTTEYKPDWHRDDFASQAECLNYGRHTLSGGEGRYVAAFYCVPGWIHTGRQW